MMPNTYSKVILCAQVTAEEQVLLLSKWNQTEAFFPSDKTVPMLVQEVMAASPTKIALVWRDRTYTYQAVRDRILPLAAHLRSLGVGPEVRVGICMSRCPDMIFAMLAVLSAGGAYVPMDPNYPADRLRFMLEDAKAPLLITQSHWSHLVKNSPSQVLTLDEGWEFPVPAKFEFHQALPHQTAYVLFTSGSTGRPKGVQIGHRSVVAMLFWAKETYSDEQIEAVMGATSICFDLSVYEIFLPLITGNTLVLAENALDLPNVTYPVTLVNTVPSAMMELCRARQIPPSVNTVNLAGEPLRSDLVAAIYANPQVKGVYNLYGPSEDTTYSTWALIPKDAPKAPAIGRPLSNTQAFVLDQTGALVKPGHEGELFLGGDGLARGYLDQPAMTAQRFLPDPFSVKPGMRMYKTGDLVRYRPDSNLDFLGRLDHQVKIRGFRIELGEIEECLRKNPEVLDTVVVAIKQSGDPQLAAYIARDGDASSDAEFRQRLRSYLAENLPGYMVPAFLVPMAELPQTPNGKVDRKALPQPSFADQGRTLVGPRTPVEFKLASIWKAALGFEEVGVFEDFFDLGGDSIRALRIVTQSRQAGLPLHTADLFRRRTIAALAESLPAEQTEKTPTNFEQLDAESTLSLSLNVAASAIWPTTAMQEGMLFQTQFSEDASDYGDIFHFSLEGNLTREAVIDAWRTLSQRHFALRTQFRFQDEKIFQVVLDQVEVDFTYIAPDEFPKNDLHLASFIDQALKQGFQPFEKPPWRIFLLQESETRWHFLFYYYHAILDGWSLAVLFREFNQLVDPSHSDKALPGLVPYNRFLNWLAAYPQAESQAYWDERLAGYNEIKNALPLPKSKAGSRRTMETVSLGQKTTDTLVTFARKNGLTLNTLVQGAWALVLARYLRSHDVIFGNSVAGRTPEVPGIESIVGLCLQNVTSRIRITSGEPLLSWLHKIQEQHRQDEQHSFFPLVELQKRLGASTQKPLFEAMLAFENYAGGDWPRDRWLGARLMEIREREDINTGLFLQALPSPVMTLKLHSDQNRFESGGSQRMLDQVAYVLENIPALADTEPATVNVIPPKEKMQLDRLRDLSASPYTPSTIVQEFQTQCRKTPDVTAVVYKNQALSYAALDALSDSLARHLLSKGLRQEEPVGLCLHRDHSLIINYFGVLKAGGVILPIDPNYPETRKAMLAEDGDLRFLIAKPEDWPGNDTSRTLLSPLLALQPAPELPLPQIATNQLAYIIYTSGSTGKPKGASIAHEAYVNQAYASINYLDMRSSDRVLQFSSHSFDLSINEIFKILFIGGTLVVESHRHGLAPDELHSLCLRQHLTTLMLTTGFWRTFCEQLALASKKLPQHMRFIMVGGERLLPENVIPFTQIAPPQLVLGNAYGPTECSVISTWHLMTASELQREIPADIPIGKALANYQINLLDPYGKDVPFGTPGELFMGGWGLARGYRNRPALTASVFVPNPFSKQPGARMYKTGDLIRFNLQEELMFVNRVDRQVKVRGFRIEMGEIEHTLRQHDQVVDAFVIAQDDPHGGKRLAAYVVVLNRGQATASAKTIHQYLDGKMPHYMVPGAFAILTELPNTLNGKINWKALPEPQPVRSSESATTPPQNELQAQIAEIWAQVLQLDKVGIHDNFFDLGGHSLTALTIHQRLQRHLDRRIPLVKLFEHPNIANLSAYLTEGQGESQDTKQDDSANRRVESRKNALRNRRRRQD